MGFDLKYYLSAGLRRLPVFLTIMLSVSALMGFIAVKLPPIYESSATLLVESPQINPDLADSTVQISPAELLQIMEKELMTRPNLIDIANEHRVYPDISEISADDLVEAMRGQTEIQLQAGREKATLMIVRFYSERPRVAARVTNEYVTRIQENAVSRRTSIARSTENFFSQQVDKLGSELDRKATEIARFKTENAGALPDNLEFNLARQTTLQERLIQTQRETSFLTENRRQLLEQFERTGNVSVQRQRELTPDERALEERRAQLNEALSIYSETHPRVRALQTQVDQLEARVANVSAAPGDDLSSPVQQDTSKTLLEIEIGKIDTQLAFAEEQIFSIEEELVALREAIERTPSNAITLEGLEREFQNTQEQYNIAQSRLSQAATGEDIEELRQGERITVVEQAVVPTEPSSPNRPLIAGGGVFLGFILGTLAIVLAEMMNKSIRRPMDITKGLGISPLVTIPYIRTRREIFMSRLKAITIPLAVTGIAAAGLFAVDQFVMPLDLVLEKITDRFDL